MGVEILGRDLRPRAGRVEPVADALGDAGHVLIAHPGQVVDRLDGPVGDFLGLGQLEQMGHLLALLANGLQFGLQLEPGIQQRLILRGLAGGLLLVGLGHGLDRIELGLGRAGEVVLALAQEHINVAVQVDDLFLQLIPLALEGLDLPADGGGGILQRVKVVIHVADILIDDSNVVALKGLVHQRVEVRLDQGIDFFE